MMEISNYKLPEQHHAQVHMPKWLAKNLASHSSWPLERKH